MRVYSENIVGMERSLLVVIRRRQLQFVGQVVRKGGLEKLMLEVKIGGKRQRGRQGLRYLEGLELAAGCGVLDILGGQASVLVSDTWQPMADPDIAPKKNKILKSEKVSPKVGKPFL